MGHPIFYVKFLDVMIESIESFAKFHTLDLRRTIEVDCNQALLEKNQRYAHREKSQRTQCLKQAPKIVYLDLVMLVALMGNFPLQLDI